VRAKDCTGSEGVIPGILSERSLPITATFRVRDPLGNGYAVAALERGSRGRSG